MDRASYRFGLLSQLRADAIGVPGQRRFRLQAEGEGGWAQLWLEKEQLYSLGLATVQLLAQHGLADASAAATPSWPGPVEAPKTAPAPEFTVGRLALGYDRDQDEDRILILAHDVAAEEDALPTFSAWVTRSQIELLSREAFAVCAAGRPLCPLCHAPLGPEPHICSKSNGHGDLSQELESDTSPE